MNVKTLRDLYTQLKNRFNEEYLKSDKFITELTIKEFDLGDIYKIKELNSVEFFKDYSKEELEDFEIMKSFVLEFGGYAAVYADDESKKFTVIEYKGE